MKLTMRLQTGEGLKVVEIDLSARDQQKSIEAMCRAYMEPALSQLGWHTSAQIQADNLARQAIAPMQAPRR